MDIAKRRGFFYPGSEIHGAPAGFWHYGPLGTTLKRRIEEAWRDFIIKEEGFYEVEGTNIMPERVFVASGHVKSFADPLIQCIKCKSLHRADKLIEDVAGVFVPERVSLEKFDEIIKNNLIRCPSCGGELGETRFFNMMFKLNVGPTEEEEFAYLRPETCQTIFVDFLQVYRSMRAKLPMGIAQIGRSFRNEISPRQGLLRQREFTQAEAEIFFNPEKIDDFSSFEELKDFKLNLHTLEEGETRKVTLEDGVEKGLIKGRLIAYYLAKVQKFIISLGIPSEAIRLREQTDEERPFYAAQAFDCDVETPLGWVEVVANHYRTDYDLTSHMEVSSRDLRVIEDGKKFIPHVWEISQGIDRTLLCVMMNGYREGDERGWEWFAFPPNIAPFQCATFPLVSKDGLPEKANEVLHLLRRFFDVYYDKSGSIGKRYARADEVGVPATITCDYQTLEDDTITIRDRDSMSQVRVEIETLPQALLKFFGGERLETLGEPLQ
ncbi:MAG: glycine--tRNA ligase [Nitrososphaeria archaeon]|nr:glycine--tRNA ligase [Nitrososphaeria archaeon]